MRERTGHLHEQPLVLVEPRDRGERFHRRFRGLERRQPFRVQCPQRLAHAQFTHEACDHRLRGPFRGFLDDAGHGGRIAHGQWRDDGEESVDTGVLEARSDGVTVRVGAGVFHQIDGVVARPVRRQLAVQFCDGPGRQRADGEPHVGRAVHGHHAGPAPVGDDGKPSADRTVARRQVFCGGEELQEARDAHGAAAAKHRVERLVGACKCVRVSRGRFRTGRAPAALQHDHGLDPCGGPQGTREAARVLHAFHVHHDAFGLGVEREEIQRLGKPHVQLIAERHDAREADAVRGGAIEHGAGQASRLREEGDAAARDGGKTERGVQSRRGPCQSQRVGTEQPESRLLRRRADSREDPAVVRPAGPQPGRQDGSGARADGSRLGHDIRQRVRACGDHDEIGLHGQIGKTRIAPESGHRCVTGIHRQERSPEGAGAHLPQDGSPSGQDIVAGPDQGNDLRLEQAGQRVAACERHTVILGKVRRVCADRLAVANRRWQGGRRRRDRVSLRGGPHCRRRRPTVRLPWGVRKPAR